MDGFFRALSNSNLKDGWRKTDAKLPTLQVWILQRLNKAQAWTTLNPSPHIHIFSMHPPWNHHSGAASPSHFWGFLRPSTSVQAPGHSIKFILVHGWALLSPVKFKPGGWMAENGKQNSPPYRFEFCRGSTSPGMDEFELYRLAGLSIDSAWFSYIGSSFDCSEAMRAYFWPFSSR